MPIVDKTDNDQFQILALSGGGYRGLYTAQLIALIEDHTGELFGSHFDLICGTSIGGILALALATREISAKTMVDKLQDIGSTLFHPIQSPSHFNLIDKKIWNSTGLTRKRGIFSAKHDNVPLQEALEDIFKDLRIKDLKTRALIPTVNWTKGGPQFFKTPHHLSFTQDRTKRLVDVAMATSAAPIYLPNYCFDNKIYVDGGLVGNAPGMFGVHETETFIRPEEQVDMRLLSMGALSSQNTANQSDPLSKGIAQWKDGLFDLMVACQEQTANYMLAQKLGSNYHMVDELLSKNHDKVVALDNASKAATETLLGIAENTFQSEIAQKDLLNFLIHHAPDIDFKHLENAA
ncbi:MAG: CBASS cGAMP-activated phospholipase [Candidatus Thiodiazotropha endolucinida]